MKRPGSYPKYRPETTLPPFNDIMRSDDASSGLQNEDGRLAANVLSFCRTLRRAGLPAGIGEVADAMIAIKTAGLQSRDDVYWALRSVLVKDPAEARLFHQAFHLYFQNPKLLERAMQLILPQSAAAGSDGGAEAVVRRLLEALSGGTSENADESRVDLDRSETASQREILKAKDFEQMTLNEQREARDLLRKEIEPLKPLLTRRFRRAAHGRRYDLRRSLQSMMRNNGELIEMMREQPRERPPVLVLICDISGSMSHYSRMFLHFAHALTARNRTAYSFVFGTRLTNISRRLRDDDIDRAMARISSDVSDWDGGTRIGECLERFNKDWSRRVLAQNAIVLLLSDGLERDEPSRLQFQMQRLQRSCRQLIWLNPALRYDRFEPRAGGIRAMLPHVDCFLPAHNIKSLAGLGELLSRGQERLERVPGGRAGA